MAESLLNPEELQYFRTARRRVDDTYNIGQAQNSYQQTVAANNYARNLGDLTRRFDQLRSKLPWSYASRGLLNSGLFQKGFADYRMDRDRAVGNLRGAYEDQASGLGLASRQLAQTRTSAFNDIEEQKRARIAAVAASLRGL